MAFLWSGELPLQTSPPDWISQSVIGVKEHSYKKILKIYPESLECRCSPCSWLQLGWRSHWLDGQTISKPFVNSDHDITTLITLHISFIYVLVTWTGKKIKNTKSKKNTFFQLSHDIWVSNIQYRNCTLLIHKNKISLWHQFCLMKDKQYNL